MFPADFLAVSFHDRRGGHVGYVWRPVLALNIHLVRVGVGLGVVYAVA